MGAPGARRPGLLAQARLHAGLGRRQNALGLRTSYYQPPALADPDQPGIIDHTGWDEPDPFVFVQNGTLLPLLVESNEPQNVPVRTGVGVRAVGPADRRAARPRPPGRRRT